MTQAIGIRVYQLARELQVTSGLLLELLDRSGCPVRSDLSVLDARAAATIRNRVTWALASERRRRARRKRGDEQPAPEGQGRLIRFPIRP